MMKSKIMHIMVIVLLISAALNCSAQTTRNDGGVTRASLKNGVTVLVRPEPEAKVAAIEVFIRVGAQDEAVYSQGVGQLLAASILSGTETFSARKLARLVSEVGGNFHAVWQWNYLEVHAVTTPPMCNDTISLLADSVKNARLDSVAVEYARTAILREIQQQGSNQFTTAYTQLRKMIHHDTPYGRAYLGEFSKIKSITSAELKEFYDDNVSPDKIVVVVAGNVNLDSVMHQLQVSFGSMPLPSRESQIRRKNRAILVKGYRPQSKPDEPAARDLILSNTSASSYLLLAYPAPGVTDPDYAAMCVANVLLGGNKSSLLFTKLREENGLGYQVGSSYPALKENSHILMFLGMDAKRATPEMVDSVKKIMTDQVDALRSVSFSDEDLDRAKRFLIGHYALEHERTRDRAFMLGWCEAVGLGYRHDFDYAQTIKGVTRADIKRVCSGYLSGKPFSVVLPGTGNP